MLNESIAGVTELTVQEMRRTAGGVGDPTTNGVVDYLIRAIIGTGDGSGTGGPLTYQRTNVQYYQTI